MADQALSAAMHGRCRVLQVSDPHFGTEQATALQALTRLVEQQAPQVLVLSGDITQRARRTQFDAARRWLDSLAGLRGLADLRVLSVPGNHDIPLFDLASRLLRPYAEYRRALGNDTAPRLQLPGLWIAGINTVCRWRHTVGRVSAHQARAVADWLRSAPAGTLRVVVTHQPAAVPDGADRAERLRGADRALRCFADAGVDLLMSGHIHRPYLMPATADVSAPWVASAGTAISTRVRAPYPHSVNLLRENGSPLAPWQVERWDLTTDADRFAPVATQPLCRPAAAPDAPQR